jgi:hypothetical protein
MLSSEAPFGTIVAKNHDLSIKYLSAAETKGFPAGEKVSPYLNLRDQPLSGFQKVMHAVLPSLGGGSSPTARFPPVKNTNRKDRCK